MAASNGYSAQVVLQLLVGGATLSLSHVGSREIVVRDECGPIPATNAEIHVQVDDTHKVHKVFLPNGIPGPRQAIRYWADGNGHAD